ncbi:transcription and mRNA export factor SUS1 [Striga asiatica]|uniref:Transcription and mRNA export factor ENY2 n=1 Tax=Striga asiatica TaxID=4170 RepID=A0A5A7PGE6_STRAF|nr:transcription and mRNA export factor SUS1 [Striga asiatica]
MSRRHSVNRPPTPDVQDDDRRSQEPTLLEIVNIKLIESGEKERLMELVRERLLECGWKDEMRALCRAIIKKNGRENVTVDDLVRAITPKGREGISKPSLLQCYAFIITSCICDMSTLSDCYRLDIVVGVDFILLVIPKRTFAYILAPPWVEVQHFVVNIVELIVFLKSKIVSWSYSGLGLKEIKANPPLGL